MFPAQAYILLDTFLRQWVVGHRKWSCQTAADTEDRSRPLPQPQTTGHSTLPPPMPCLLVGFTGWPETVGMHHATSSLSRPVVFPVWSRSARLPCSSNGKESACNAGDLGSIPGSGRSLEKRMATHSSVLARRIPWTEKPGGLQSMELQRVGHDWVLYARSAASESPGNFCPLLTLELGFQATTALDFLVLGPFNSRQLPQHHAM